MSREPRRFGFRLHVAAGALALAWLGCGGGGGSGALFLAFTSLPPSSAAIREAYAYSLTIANAVGTPVYAITTGPAGMTVDASGLVTWTPQYADLGTHPVTVQVTDDVFTISQSWSLRVHQGILMGVTLSPRGHTLTSTTQDYVDHFTGHDPWGEVVAFHSAWRNDVQSAGQIPDVALFGVTAAATYGFTPVIGLGWSDGQGVPDLISQSEPSNNSWSNAETRVEYLQMVTAFAQAHRPPYLFLGNETNTYFVTHTAPEWADWISEFEACYDAIKAVSPTTVVFTVFQLERMKGLGSKNGWSGPSHWSLVADHAQSGKIDAIGFTSYPYMEYDGPADVPAGYYDEIATWWSGPVLFTELGWLGWTSFPYLGSPADQAAWVPRFFALTDDLDLEYACWIFLHDWDRQSTIPVIDGVGLRTNDGSVVRPADAAWRSEVALRQR